MAFEDNRDWNGRVRVVEVIVVLCLTHTTSGRSNHRLSETLCLRETSYPHDSSPEVGIVSGTRARRENRVRCAASRSLGDERPQNRVLFF